ncbi:hypothetical protein Tco_1286137 [Tanacetum coccineum]
MLGISITYEDFFTKYVVGLQREIQNELRMYSFEDISCASHIAMAIEMKNKNSGLKIEEHVKERIVERDNKKKVTVTTNNLNNFFEEVDKSLTIMMKPTSKVTKETEELFTLKIQVKQEVIEAIVDTGSEKNLISSSLSIWRFSDYQILPWVDGPTRDARGSILHMWVAAFQAPLSPDYVSGPEYPPSPDFVPDPVYPEFMPPEDEVLPAEE